jgi:hypothetical protein
MTSLYGVSPSRTCDRCRWQLSAFGVLPAPVRRFLLVAVELLPEQVIALKIVRDRHIEGTPLVLFPLLRHLHIELADVRVADRKLRIRRSFCKVLTLLRLRRAPGHPGHTCTCVPVQVYPGRGTSTLRHCERGDKRSCPSCLGSIGTLDGAGSSVLFSVFLPYHSPCVFLNSVRMLCSSRARAVLILCYWLSDPLGTP